MKRSRVPSTIGGGISGFRESICERKGKSRATVDAFFPARQKIRRFVNRERERESLDESRNEQTLLLAFIDDRFNNVRILREEKRNPTGRVQCWRDVEASTEEDVQEVGLVIQPGRCLPGDGHFTYGMRDTSHANVVPR